MATSTASRCSPRSRRSAGSPPASCAASSSRASRWAARPWRTGSTTRRPACSTPGRSTCARCGSASRGRPRDPRCFRPGPRLPPAMTSDAVIIGSGPNGLAAAVHLAQAGAAVLVLEAASEIGGGTRSGELTLPGFVHDRCSAVHPMAILSPWLRQLPLAEHGLTWIQPPASLAHPLDDQPAALLRRSLADTASELGSDARAYRRLLEPFLRDPHGLLADALGPLGLPRHPLLMLRFGLHGLRSATGVARRVSGAPARALFAGC